MDYILWISLDTIYPSGLNKHISDFGLSYLSLLSKVWGLCFNAKFVFVLT